MNNETNQDAEAFELWFLNWLLPEEFSESTNRGEDENFDPHIDTNNLSTELELDSIEPLELEELDFLCEENELLAQGEIPMIENRVQTLLKERFKMNMENEQKLPLFPWESEKIPEYPEVKLPRWEELAERVQLPRWEELAERVKLPRLDPAKEIWMPQMENLKWENLSIPITENVFAQLLDSCQKLVLSGLQDGAKMLRAVEDLFPGQSQLLNDMSNRVLLGATRDSLDPNLIPKNYEEAHSYQQMLLSLLAAKDIINSLTISCRPNETAARRRWETSMGTMILEAEYRVPETESDRCLRIKAIMPAAGNLQLKGMETVVSQERTQKGVLEVQLLNPQPDQTYELNVGFQNCSVKPLRFAVCLKQI